MTRNGTTTTHDDPAVQALIAHGWLDGLTRDNLAQIVKVVRDTGPRTAGMEIHYADEWAALYVDGQLVWDTVGDKYLAEEQAFELCGVKQVHDPAFLRGQSQRSGVAPTLTDVEEYRQEREARREQAARLREEAARLVAEATALEEQ